MAVEFHIAAKPINDTDNGPQVIIGFAGADFSQAVFIDAPQDAGEAVQMADALYKGFLEACGAAVKKWNEVKK